MLQGLCWKDCPFSVRSGMESRTNWRSYLLIAATVSVSVLKTFSTDPCTDYHELNQVRRSSAAEVQAGHSLLCDNTLAKDWYRFISYVGGEIPTTCVEPYHCGTQVPIWMNGTLPTDSTVVTRQVCPNYGVPGNCCPFPWNIQVKRCVDTQGVFYVYELVPTTSCSQAYCAGTLPVCPEGEVYHHHNNVCLETRHPVPCDFEELGTCEWQQQADDDFDWIKKKSANGVESLLPAVDHTIGITGGHFLYVGSDAGQQPLDKARIIGPVIVPSVVRPCNMTFSYYFSGPDAGDLDVFTRQYYTGVERPAWQESAGTAGVWAQGTVSFQEQDPFQVIIRGEIGYGQDVVIAIDDIFFSWDCVREVDGSVRLVDGSRFDEGRVEIYYNHRWGTICNIGWTQTSADVVCAQLGYKESVWTESRYPAPDSTPILLDDVTCDSRNKSRITECRTKPWENWSPLCNHARDVAVRCLGQWHQCTADQFVCDNAVCLPLIAQCDSKDDCGDGSDESNCGNQSSLTGMILAILLATVVALMIGVAICIFYHRQKKAKTESSQQLGSLPIRPGDSGDNEDSMHGATRDVGYCRIDVDTNAPVLADSANVVPTSKDRFHIDSSSQASLVKNTVDVGRTEKFSGEPDARLRDFLKRNCFDEYIDTMSENQLSYESLQSCKNVDLVNLGIPLAKAIGILTAHSSDSTSEKDKSNETKEIANVSQTRQIKENNSYSDTPDHDARPASALSKLSSSATPMAYVDC